MASKKPAVELPNLSNATTGFLIDEIGKLREEASRIKTLDEYHKAALEGHLRDAENKVRAGESFAVTVIPVNQERFDKEAVMAFLGKLWDASPEAQELMESEGMESKTDTSPFLKPLSFNQHRFNRK